ncbi:WhiB family transcriptional regulator [Nocardia sp. NBC_01327]|uniref:WhiB family transcriptional regulator n=1 Tax=Nocardia sp. NBC_01327 TaxID=2903593 RepID=UPI002E100F91|nr:WhiB family transcriptional regulator [Nocardia sp. NBC_01327]
MSDWWHESACRGHKSPELWCRNTVDPAAAVARRICFQDCPVRLECGAWGLQSGEHELVAGGYRLWHSGDARRLRAEHPDVTPGARVAAGGGNQAKDFTCSDCGTVFTATRTTLEFPLCQPCRKGLVPAQEVRQHIQMLLDSGLRMFRIDELARVIPGTTSAFMRPKSARKWTKAETAERIRAVGLPEAMSA